MLIEHHGKLYCIEGSKHCVRAGRRCSYLRGDHGEERAECTVFEREIPIDEHGRPSKLPECILKSKYAGKGQYERITRGSKTPTYDEIYNRLTQLEKLDRGKRMMVIRKKKDR